MSQKSEFEHDKSSGHATQAVQNLSSSKLGFAVGFAPRCHEHSLNSHQQLSTAMMPRLGQQGSEISTKNSSGMSRPLSVTTTSSNGASFDPESLEARFERLLSMVEEAGFDSIDSMVATYYTAQFSDQSIMQPMQAASRTRRLRTLLTALQSGQHSWTEREKCAYSEEVTRAAEQIYSEELRGKPQVLCSSSASSSGGDFGADQSGSIGTTYHLADVQTGGGGGEFPLPRSPTGTADVAQRIMEILSGPEAAEFLQRERAAFQRRVRLISIFLYSVLHSCL